MTDLTILYWRDIPAQILARAGCAVAKRELPQRFQQAIDSAAMGAGARGSDAYLAEWRRGEKQDIDGAPEEVARLEAERIERDYDAARLQRLVENGGRARAEPLVFFAPSGKRGRFPAGSDLLSAARALGVDLDSVCGGRGICGRCQIVVEEGDHPKLGVGSRAAHAGPVNAVETRYVEKRGVLRAGRRLACQTRLEGDLVVDVPEESQLHRQIVRKFDTERTVAVDPVARLHYVEVAPPDLKDPSGDARRLKEALAAQWNLGEIAIAPALLGDLQRILRAGGWKVTAALRHGREIVALYPGFKERIFGVALDIGSTTLAAHLCELASGESLAAAGAMNPQIRFGEDLMSRISYAMTNPDGRKAMTRAVREAADALIGRVAEEAGVARGDLVELVAVGNPAMHHLFLGLDPTELGRAPFAPAIDEALDIAAHDLDLDVAPGAAVHLPPLIAGHVGADASAVLLAEAPHLSDEITLIVDVGTNAEIILGNRSRLLACSSPTGPAFEGAQISSGQRAAPGAIERVRIDAATLEPRYRIIGCDLWSDDPGFEEASRSIGVTGICGSGIVEAMAEMFVAGIVGADGRIDGALAARSARIAPDGRTCKYVLRAGTPEIAVTQADIRAIQLAKAALYAGARLLMDRLGAARVDRVKLAGAFGSQIDPTHAMILGLIPDCPLDRVAAVGNAAGHGARIALVNAAAREEMAALARRIEKVETAIEPGFQAQFVAAMTLPHACDEFPNLAARVALPERRPAARARRRRG